MRALVARLPGAHAAIDPATTRSAEQVDLLEEIERAERDGGANAAPVAEDAADVAVPSLDDATSSAEPEPVLEDLLEERRVHPNSAEVHARLGGALCRLGRFEEAEQAFRQADRLSPNDPEVRERIGILEFRRGRYDRAASVLQWVCDKEPDRGLAHVYWGEALNRVGRVRQALAVLERAIELEPENSRIYHTLGMLYDKLHEPEEAARMYRKARDLTSS